MTIGDKPMLLSPDKDRAARRVSDAKSRKEGGKPARDHKRRDKPRSEPDADKERYRIEVGHKHGVKPGNIVGAIANESGLDGEHIGHIEIDTDFSLIDLPKGMPRDIFMDLKKVRVCGEAIKISHFDKAKQPQEKKRTSTSTRSRKSESTSSPKRKSKPSSPKSKGRPSSPKSKDKPSSPKTRKGKPTLALKKKDGGKRNNDKGKRRGR
jgi:ATP-dependent RNA helicase DeaD